MADAHYMTRYSFYALMPSATHDARAATFIFAARRTRLRHAFAASGQLSSRFYFSPRESHTPAASSRGPHNVFRTATSHHARRYCQLFDFVTFRHAGRHQLTSPILATIRPSRRHALRRYIDVGNTCSPPRDMRRHAQLPIFLDIALLFARRGSPCSRHYAPAREGF